MAHHMLTSWAMTATNPSVTAIAFGLLAQQCIHYIRQTTAAAIALSRVQRGSLENTLVRVLPIESLKHFFEFPAYDETPLQVRTRDTNKFHVGTHALGPKHANEAIVAVDPSHRATTWFGPASQLLETKASTPQKIVQTQLCVGMLATIGHESVSAMMRQPTQLSLVAYKTADVLEEQQSRVSHALRASAVWRRRTRGAIADGDSALAVVERNVAERRWGVDGSLHITCEVHKQAHVHEKTFSLIEDDTSGMIRTALALRNGAATGIFRQCMAQEIASRLEILDGVFLE